MLSRPTSAGHCGLRSVKGVMSERTPTTSRRRFLLSAPAAAVAVGNAIPPHNAALKAIYAHWERKNTELEETLAAHVAAYTDELPPAPAYPDVWQGLDAINRDETVPVVTLY